MLHGCLDDPFSMGDKCEQNTNSEGRCNIDQFCNMVTNTCEKAGLECPGAKEYTNNYGYCLPEYFCSEGKCIKVAQPDCTEHSDCVEKGGNICTEEGRCKCGSSNACDTGVTCCPRDGGVCLNLDALNMEGCDVCAEGFAKCEGESMRCETNLLTNGKHCGQCHNDCRELENGSGECIDGECACQEGYALCGGICINVDDDNNNCGDCGSVCSVATGAFSAQCSGGECIQNCISGNERMTHCTDECVNIETHVSHCGGCDKACSAKDQNTVSCDGGECQYKPCNQTVCDNNCVDLQTHSSYCGSCSIRCKSSETCVEGKCESKISSNECSYNEDCTGDSLCCADVDNNGKRLCVEPKDMDKGNYLCST